MTPQDAKFNEVRTATIAKLLSIYVTSTNKSVIDDMTEMFNEMIDEFIDDNTSQGIDVDVDDLTFYIGYGFEDDNDFWKNIHFADNDNATLMLNEGYDPNKRIEPSLALRKATGRCV